MVYFSSDTNNCTFLQLYISIILCKGFKFRFNTQQVCDLSKVYACAILLSTNVFKSYSTLQGTDLSILYLVHGTLCIIVPTPKEACVCTPTVAI